MHSRCIGKCRKKHVTTWTSVVKACREKCVAEQRMPGVQNAIAARAVGKGACSAFTVFRRRSPSTVVTVGAAAAPRIECATPHRAARPDGQARRRHAHSRVDAGSLQFMAPESISQHARLAWPEAALAVRSVRCGAPAGWGMHGCHCRRPGAVRRGLSASMKSVRPATWSGRCCNRRWRSERTIGATRVADARPTAGRSIRRGAAR